MVLVAVVVGAFFSITSLKQPIYQFKRKILFATEARSHFLDVTFYHVLFLSLSLSITVFVDFIHSCTFFAQFQTEKKELTFRSKQLFRMKSTTWKMVLKWKKSQCIFTRKFVLWFCDYSGVKHAIRIALGVTDDFNDASQSIFDIIISHHFQAPKKNSIFCREKKTNHRFYLSFSGCIMQIDN